MARTAPAAPAAPDELALKRAFAEALLRQPHKPAEAAYTVFPTDAGRRLQATNTWPKDAEVKAAMAALVSERGAEHFAPTREEVARELLDIARDPALTAKERTDAYRAYGDYRGFARDVSAKVDLGDAMAELMGAVAASGRPKPPGV